VKTADVELTWLPSTNYRDYTHAHTHTHTVKQNTTNDLKTSDLSVLRPNALSELHSINLEVQIVRHLTKKSLCYRNANRLNLIRKIIYYSPSVSSGVRPVLVLALFLVRLNSYFLNNSTR